jgi:beta-phosphoglucomutase-like phosphatase (HAD superfamily)
VIEDAPAGIRAAVAAGMANVALLGTASRDTLLEAGARLTVESLRELTPDVLTRLIDGAR